jgi:hypothetical protein
LVNSFVGTSQLWHTSKAGTFVKGQDQGRFQIQNYCWKTASPHVTHIHCHMHNCLSFLQRAKHVPFLTANCCEHHVHITITFPIANPIRTSTIN